MAGDAEQLANGISLISGDCLAALPMLEADSFDACVTDPPYHLTTDKKGGTGIASLNENSPAGRSRISTGFMGKAWDGGDVAFQVETWEQVYRVLKPGAHLLACGGTRTYHRMACAIADAGFEVRDCVQWLYGSGFPKSHDVSKGIDRESGAERELIRVDAADLNNPPNLVGGAVKGDDRPWRLAAIERGYHEKAGNVSVTDAAREWEGWGTALKPACELIVLARKPLSEKTIAANILKWGTGAINVDGCRVATDGPTARPPLSTNKHEGWQRPWNDDKSVRAEVEARREVSHDKRDNLGRWPANVIHDGSDEVVAAFPDADGGNFPQGGKRSADADSVYGTFAGNNQKARAMGDSGSAARFFYTAKADNDDRLGSKHPTVKPLDLMQYLVRLITPPRGLVLDPFAGTGTTGEAAFREGFRAVLIEREGEYQKDIRRRMKLLLAGSDERAHATIKEKTKDKPIDAGPLFDWLAANSEAAE